MIYTDWSNELKSSVSITPSVRRSSSRQELHDLAASGAALSKYLWSISIRICTWRKTRQKCIEYAWSCTVCSAMTWLHAKRRQSWSNVGRVATRLWPGIHTATKCYIQASSEILCKQKACLDRFVCWDWGSVSIYREKGLMKLEQPWATRSKRYQSSGRLATATPLKHLRRLRSIEHDQLRRMIGWNGVEWTVKKKSKEKSLHGETKFVKWSGIESILLSKCAYGFVNLSTVEPVEPVGTRECQHWDDVSFRQGFLLSCILVLRF